MEKCKYCQQELEEGSTVCPHCGKDNAAAEQSSEEKQEVTSAEASASEEVTEEKTDTTASEEKPEAEEAEAKEQAEEEDAQEEKPEEEKSEEEKTEEEKPEEEKSEEEKPEEEKAEEKKPEEAPKKATPGQIAMGVVAVVVLAAVLVALIVSALGQKKEDVEPDLGTTATTAAMETEPVETTPPTVPADGNPDDATCKGTYSATAEEIEAAGDEIVASVAEFTLNNRQLQIYYWKTVQMFQQSNPYAAYIIDWSLPLDVQPCLMAEGMTWQQFFLQNAFETWQNYQSMAAEAEANKIPQDPQLQTFLNELPGEIDKQAKENGFEDAQALLASDVGPGPSIQDYVDFMELYYKGEGYFNYFLSVANPDEEELEAYFEEHKKELEEGGITKDSKAVDVRHVLITPEDSGDVAAWEAAEQQAQKLFDDYKAGEMTEEAFAAIATEHSMDPGSKETGGLYEHVVPGQMVPEFDQWCFDDSRKAGDVDVVKTDYGYHIMFYSGDQPIWQEMTTRIYMDEKVRDLMERNAATYPLTVEYEKVLLSTPELPVG